jgi:hypothetical protein
MGFVPGRYLTQCLMSCFQHLAFNEPEDSVALFHCHSLQQGPLQDAAIINIDLRECGRRCSHAKRMLQRRAEDAGNRLTSSAVVAS